MEAAVNARAKLQDAAETVAVAGNLWCESYEMKCGRQRKKKPRDRHTRAHGFMCVNDTRARVFWCRVYAGLIRHVQWESRGRGPSAGAEK